MSYLWSAVGGNDIKVLARRAMSPCDPAGWCWSTISWSMTRTRRRNFAAMYLLSAVLDNPQAECLTPAFVEGALRDAGFDIEGTETMLDEITSVTRARRR